MANPHIAEITIFAGNFAPRGWAMCEGQLLPISQYTALFSLIGTIYGGDGRTTFSLPDLRGRLPVHPGNGPGLSSRRLGEKSGKENETITIQQLPSHNHLITGDVKVATSQNAATTTEGSGNVLAVGDSKLYNTGPVNNNEVLDGVEWDVTLQNTGGGQSHNNLQPYIAINFIIALQGIYPSRN